MRQQTLLNVLAVLLLTALASSVLPSDKDNQRSLGILTVQGWWPISNVTNNNGDVLTSAFGARRLSNDPYDFHEGIDIRANHRPVYAAFDGTIHQVVAQPDNRNTSIVILRHVDLNDPANPNDDQVFYTHYIHLQYTQDLSNLRFITGANSPQIIAGSNGQTFTDNQGRVHTVNPFAESGNSGTGNPPGTGDPHLHFAGTVGGTSTGLNAINPMRGDSLPYNNQGGPTIMDPRRQITGGGGIQVDFDVRTSHLELDLNRIEVTHGTGANTDWVIVDFDSRINTDSRFFPPGNEDGTVNTTSFFGHDVTIRFFPVEFAAGFSQDIYIIFSALATDWNQVNTIRVRLVDTQGVETNWPGPGTGVEDAIVINSGPTVLSQNANVTYTGQFIDESPYGDYIASNWTWGLNAYHDGGAQTLVTGSTTGAQQTSWNFTVPNLNNWNWQWKYDANQRVQGLVYVSAVDNDGILHATQLTVGINAVPAQQFLQQAQGKNRSVDLIFGARGAAGFKIYYDTNSGVPYTGVGADQGASPITVNSSSPSGINTFTLTGLTNGTTYYFAIKAFNATGESGYSSEDPATPITTSGTLAQSETWPGTGNSDTVLVTGSVTIPNGKILMINPGAVLKFDSGVSMTVQSGGRISAIGNSTRPILFSSSLSNPGRSSYGTIFIYSNNNYFGYCTIEYSDWGLKFVGPASGNTVTNCTFRQNDQAIRIHYNDAEVHSCLIENNRHAFVLIDNTSQYGNIYINSNTVRNNDRDGIYSINSVVDAFRTVLDNNGLGNVSTYHGIWATSSSDIALGSRTWNEDLSFTGGFNTVKNNHGAGIYVGTSSLVLLGDLMTLPTVTVYRAGNNSIHNNGTISGTYSGKEVYNATSTTVEANKNYWGGTPTSSQFDPPVDYASWLTSLPNGTSIVGLPPGDGSSAIPSPLAKSGQSQTSGDDDDTRIKKEMIRNLRALIAQSPESPEAVAALMTIFSFIRTDRNDKLGERDGIYGYLNGLYQAHGQLEIGKRALHLMSIERLSRNEFAEAIGLAQTATARFSGPLRQESMSLQIRLLLRTGQITAAQQLFDAFKNDYPDDQIMQELLQDMFKQAEYDFANGALIDGALVRPEPNSKDKIAASVPSEFSIAQNFPNPFNPTTMIRYALPHDGKVTLNIFNILGEKARTLVDELKPAGNYTAIWDGKNSRGETVASGIYIYQIFYLPSEPFAKAMVRSGKMSLLR